MNDGLGDLFTPLTGPTLTGGSTRKCSHPRHARLPVPPGGLVPAPGLGANPIATCALCGHDFYAERTKRGRNNRARGNRIELEMARALGMHKVGQYGGAEDATSEPFVAQVKSKSGRAFPARWHDEIARLPVTAAQTPLLVIAEAGVVGRKRRALVVLRLEDWTALHAGVPREGER